MKRAVAAPFLACAAASYSACAAAQCPERALRLVVPQAPGSATDTVARILAPEMAKILGQPVVVENRPGGALAIGIDAVAKAAPDGYTVGMGPIGALAITRHISAVNEGIRAPIFVDRFARIGDQPAGGTPQDFADTIRRDSARWGEVVRRSGAKID